MHRLSALFLVPLLLLASPGAAAVRTADPAPPTVTVRLLTQGTAGLFRIEPALVWVDPGTRVRFPLDSHIHGVRSVPGMLPEGAEPVAGGVGVPAEVTLEVEGVYGIKCPSHYALGMVGLIVVGDPSANLEAARAVRHPPAAQTVFDRLFELLDCLRRGGPCAADLPVADLRSGHLADHPEGE